MNEVSEQHRGQAEGLRVSCAVLTCSDTRTKDDDRSGALIRQLLEQSGHEVVSYRVVREDPGHVLDALAEAASSADAVLLTGGTGLSARDGTVEAVLGFIQQEMPGYGELFRSLSYAEIGAAAMLSRAVAGVKDGTVIFAMPGSTAAVRLAMTRLILPELRHIIGILFTPSASDP